MLCAQACNFQFWRSDSGGARYLSLYAYTKALTLIGHELGTDLTFSVTPAAKFNMKNECIGVI